MTPELFVPVAIALTFLGATVFEQSRRINYLRDRITAIEEQCSRPSCEICNQPAAVLSVDVSPDGAKCIWLCQECLLESAKADLAE